MAYALEELSKSNAAEWDAFLCNQPYHNPFQSGKLFLCLKDQNNYQPGGVIAREMKNNRIVGGGVVFKIIEKPGILAKLATRAVMNGGPIVAKGHENAIPLLLERLIRIFEKEAVYTETWNMQSLEAYAGYFKKEFVYMPHLNFFVDLEDPVEKIFKRISRSTRKHIKAAQKKNLKIKPVENEKEFAAMYQCLAETYRRVQVPLIAKSVFQRVYEGKAGIFLLALHEDKPIAARVLLTFGQEIYDWYAGDKQAYTQYYPNENLVWWVLEYGVKNGYKWFNFGGAGKPGEEYGPREFKRRFGGRKVEYGRYRHVNRKFYYLLTRGALPF
jgi:serine/alanine adding enzyme